MRSLKLGDVEVMRLVELDTAEVAPLSKTFPDHDLAAVRANASWLAPDHVNLETGFWKGCVQTFVVRSAGKTILVDTGLGNHKERPYFRAGTHLDTDYLDRLAALGATPADVDIVVATHLHVDHVGWNTWLEGRRWVPTFPNATYLFARADVDYWNPLGPGYAPTPFGRLTNQNVYEDSVAPIIKAALATVWEGDRHRIDENLVLESMPGHTPGSAVVSLESGGDRALFIGDVCHSPFQAVTPDCGSCYDEDLAAAARSRRQLVSRAAETKALMLAPHFGDAIEVTRNGDGFAFAGWTSFR